ncbi:hypothetical protein ACWEO1_19260 [Kitasatospora cineracea]
MADRVMSREETIRRLLDRSGRQDETFPVRCFFVQQNTGLTVGARRVGGPLAKLLRSPEAFNLLLLVYAVTTSGDFGVTERSETWGRASGIYMAPDGGASIRISRQWRRLEDLNLIKRIQDGRHTRIVRLHENGRGEPYVRPGGGYFSNLYFKVPFAYWYDKWDQRLSMPGKAVLLIGMSWRRRHFSLPESIATAKSYGISTQTLRRGIGDLKENGLLEDAGWEEYETGESATGYAHRKLYQLLPPFDQNLTVAAREREREKQKEAKKV